MPFDTLGLEETLLKICAIDQETHHRPPDLQHIYNLICAYKHAGGEYRFKIGAKYDPQDINEHGWFPEGIHLSIRRGNMEIKDGEVHVTPAGRFFAGALQLPVCLKSLETALLNSWFENLE